ncbi:MAG: hypothetical protein ACI30S_05005 [Muribaculaceae bacterium]
MRRLKSLILTIFFLISAFKAESKGYELFSEQVKTDYPSVVYDFLERYLYEVDSLDRKENLVEQKMRDDKVYFISGEVRDAAKINLGMKFEMKKSSAKYYEVAWYDSIDSEVLRVAFPMDFELILGKPKAEIEKEFKNALKDSTEYKAELPDEQNIEQLDSIVYRSKDVKNYYLESLNNAKYYYNDSVGGYAPIFTEKDRWHSAINLFLGAISDVEGYKIHVEQSLYGFNKETYTITLGEWLNYCRRMRLETYMSIEEEREDGLKALLIAESEDLGFNHMLYLLIPADFVSNRGVKVKAKLNAYIPTQNVKDLYQKHVEREKKQIDFE